MKWGEVKVGDAVAHPNGTIAVLLSKESTMQGVMARWFYIDMEPNARWFFGHSHVHESPMHVNDDLEDWEHFPGGVCE